MRAYLALPLLAALIAIGCGTAIAALSPRERANQLGALVMASIALWAGCEVLWTAALTEDAALTWHRVAAPGFVFLGVHGGCFIGHLDTAVGAPVQPRAVPMCSCALVLGRLGDPDVVG